MSQVEKETEESAYIQHLKMRAEKAEQLARVCFRVNPMIKNLRPVKDAFEVWGHYVDLHTILKVRDDHE
jgi:hypothetical protein